MLTSSVNSTISTIISPPGSVNLTELLIKFITHLSISIESHSTIHSSI